ncbi:MAG: hypothetical protein JWM11_1091 [Planctomycetaceae bacterium]|nr:hypothetical protein [Planctomycetaceae bacterium]
MQSAWANRSGKTQRSRQYRKMKRSGRWPTSIGRAVVGDYRDRSPQATSASEWIEEIVRSNPRESFSLPQSMTNGGR